MLAIFFLLKKSIKNLGISSYTSFWLHFYVGSLSYTSCACFFFFIIIILSGEFLLHIPCWLYFYLGSFSYTSRVYLRHAALASFSFLFYLGSFPQTSSAGFICIWGVSLTHPKLASFLPGSFSYASRASFIFLWGVSLTHPMLAFKFFFISGVFHFHIQC